MADLARTSHHTQQLHEVAKGWGLIVELVKRRQKHNPNSRGLLEADTNYRQQ